MGSGQNNPHFFILHLKTILEIPRSSAVRTWFPSVRRNASRSSARSNAGRSIL